MILILIFNNDEDITEKIKRKISKKDLMLSPCLVGKEYRTRGYFFTVKHTEIKIDIEPYGFYELFDGFYYNEYDEKLNATPEIVFMGSVYTISGIAYDMNKKMIIRGN